MSERMDSRSATGASYQKEDRTLRGKDKVGGHWAHLDEETRVRYEAIVKRCVEKWGKG